MKVFFFFIERFKRRDDKCFIGDKVVGYCFVNRSRYRKTSIVRGLFVFWDVDLERSRGSWRWYFLFCRLYRLFLFDF